MQILPANYTDRTDELLPGSSMANSEDDSFSQILDQAMSREETPSVEEEYPYLADNPYSQNPEVFSPFVPQEVRLNKDEAERLVTALREQGVDEQVLAAIRDMSAIPGGATLEQLLNAGLKAIEGEQNILSKQERERLETLLNKIGGDGGQELYKTFRNGTDKQAMDKLLEQLNNMQADLNLTREEMALLAKALNLPENIANNLLAKFAGGSELTLSGQDMAELLAVADAELSSRQARKDSLLSALDKGAAPIMKEASAREEAERLGMMREDKSVAQSRTLIQDNATQGMFGRETEADQSKQTRSVSKNGEFGNPSERAEKADKSALSEAAEKTARGPVDQLTGQKLFSEEKTESDSGKGRKEFSWRSADNSKPDAKAESANKSSNQQPTGQLYAAVTPGVGNVNPVFTPNQPQTAQPNQFPQQAMDQIEQAILTASKNGIQRLEVALNPVELGAITVVLTSRAGELSAVIRPEKAETTAMLQQQVEQIRVELENQGFKIDRIDVENPLTANDQHNWQSPEQHNTWREMNDQLESMDRLRRLSKSGDLGLARPVQNSGQTANNSGQGLHLVA